MELGGKRVLVVGAGKSGQAAACFCAQRGAGVVLSDKCERSITFNQKVSFEIGHRLDSFLSADLIVVSPGVPKLDELCAADKNGVPIVGEVELASRFIEAPIVAITGTNGKSTVTALCGEIARHTGRPTFVGGNLGTPLIECVGTIAASKNGIVVVEVSSFQLETCTTFHPRAAAILNITPDHLDRYANLDEYAAAKWRIAFRMNMDDVLVLNENVLRGVKYDPAMTVLEYSTDSKNGVAAFIDDAEPVLESVDGERFPVAEMNLVGNHNLGNSLAALLLMRASKLASYEQARAGLRSFQPLPHRMQLIGEKRGVCFYDDSKATNVDSVVAGLDGFPRPFVLIAGGRDKGGSYAPLGDVLLRNSCRGVVLIGEAAPLIDRALSPSTARLIAPSLQDAVKQAFALSAEHGAVVLSPACSSYDMFENYEHRGRVFAAAVEALDG